MGVVIPTFDPMLSTSDALRPNNPVIETKFDEVRSTITLRWRDATACSPVK